MDFTEAASDGGTTAQDAAMGDYILYAEAVSRDRQQSRVFYIPINGIDDNEELSIQIAEPGQHDLLKPWVEFFSYCGAEVAFLESESSFRVRTTKSWHDLLLKGFIARSNIAIQDDDFWAGYASVSVLLIDSATLDVLNGTTQIPPSFKGEIEPKRL